VRPQYSFAPTALVCSWFSLTITDHRICLATPLSGMLASRGRGVAHFLWLLAAVSAVSQAHAQRAVRIGVAGGFHVEVGLFMLRTSAQQRILTPSEERSMLFYSPLPRAITKRPDQFLGPYAVNGMGSATRSRSQVGTGSLHDR